jgi:hypothetical protein
VASSGLLFRSDNRCQREAFFGIGDTLQEACRSPTLPFPTLRTTSWVLRKSSKLDQKAEHLHSHRNSGTRLSHLIRHVSDFVLEPLLLVGVVELEARVREVHGVQQNGGVAEARNHALAAVEAQAVPVDGVPARGEPARRYMVRKRQLQKLAERQVGRRVRHDHALAERGQPVLVSRAAQAAVPHPDARRWQREAALEAPHGYGETAPAVGVSAHVGVRGRSAPGAGVLLRGGERGQVRHEKNVMGS